ncbi:MAG: hemerythrin domain-containing protein [Planctomycetota bacterium]|nr:hemerythrin domain-containing protein [Planctomycetota bacterium]
MPRPTDNLRADHSVVARALVVLEALADHVRSGGSFPVQDCATVLRFLREFLLPIHFRKENELVWPAVAMRGEERSAALVGDLLRLQDEVAELVHTLVVFWEPVGELTSAEREGFAATATALVAQLRRMQELEEHELFRMCDATVPADDQLGWLAAFAQLDGERGPLAQWATRIDRLVRDWRR